MRLSEQCIMCRLRQPFFCGQNPAGEAYPACFGMMFQPERALGETLFQGAAQVL